MKKLIFFILGLVCAATIAQAQSPSKIRPLKIGDTVPDISMGTAINYSKPGIQFSDFKNKLLILDFWSSWCSPCVRALPDFNRLQREFHNDIQILLATPQGKDKIISVLSKRNIRLPSIYRDTLLSELFPHQSVPHEVWIKNNKVFAITGDYEVSSKNIKMVLSGKITSFPERTSNFKYDLKKPLLFDNNGGNESDLLYHSLFTRYLDGVGGGGVFMDSLGRYKLRAINYSVLELYQFVLRRKGEYALCYDNRSIIKANEKEKLVNTQSPKYYPSAKENYYSYELIVPYLMKKRAPDIMWEDLNRFFGGIYKIKGVIEKKDIQCLALKKIGKIDNLLSTSSTSEISSKDSMLIYKKQPFSHFYNAVISIYRNENLPIVDKTGITSDISITFPSNVDISKFNECLRKYGLGLIKETCKVNMLVIEQTK